MKTKRRAILTASLVGGLLYGATSGYMATQRKFHLIESHRAQPASRVTFPQPELNDWVRYEVARLYPDSVRKPAVELGAGAAVGSALIDFGKLRRDQGNPPGAILSRLLDGERPVRVAARLESGGGQATVHVQSVEISGFTIDGPVLDYLIRNYLLPRYPEVKIGEPFQLSHNIEKVEVRPSAVDVLIRR